MSAFFMDVEGPNNDFVSALAEKVKSKEFS